jgi:hypothetical protein
MKKYILIFALLSILVSCKKDDPEPEPVTPDYADGLVGTYVGTEINYGTDNSSKEYENTSKTMTVTKLEKNKIKVESFQGNYAITFTLTSGGGDDVLMSSSAPYQAYGIGNCKYFASPKKLGIYVKDVNSLKYKYYSGTKQ